MLLTIDIGNTNITLGLYDGKELGPRWRLATAFDHMPDEYGLQLLGLIEHAGHNCCFGRWDLPGIRRTSHYQQDYRSLPALSQPRTVGGGCRRKNRGARAL